MPAIDNLLAPCHYQHTHCHEDLKLNVLYDVCQELHRFKLADRIAAELNWTMFLCEGRVIGAWMQLELQAAMPAERLAGMLNLCQHMMRRTALTNYGKQPKSAIAAPAPHVYSNERIVG